MRELPLGVQRVFIGLVLNEPSRYSAYSVIGKTRQRTGTAWQVLELDRFPSMSRRDDIAALVASTWEIPFISSRRPTVCISSIVGTEEMVTRLKSKGVSLARIEVVNLTGGVSMVESQPQTHSIPKTEVAMTYISLVEDKRVVVALSDQETEGELRRQLESFTLRLKRRQLDADAEAEDIDEDLILACAVPIWFGSSRAVGDKHRPATVQPESDPWKYMRSNR